MFTGLVQKVGSLRKIERRGDGGRLFVGHDAWGEPLTLGESVAVQGVCLTVTSVHADGFECDVLLETLKRTNLGAMRSGASLNLERSMRPSDRLGGHFVTGHVDGVGTVSDLSRESEDWVLEIKPEKDLLVGVCPKGSVACDGVSLTVVDVFKSSFSIRLIPFTWQNTSLSSLKRSLTVNIETDILGKYVRRYSAAAPADITVEKLREFGFLQ